MSSRGLSLQSPHKGDDLGRERFIGCPDVVDLRHVIVSPQLLQRGAPVVTLAKAAMFPWKGVPAVVLSSRT